MSAQDVGLFVGGALAGGIVVGAIVAHAMRAPQTAVRPIPKRTPPPYKPDPSEPPVTIDWHRGSFWVKLNRPGRAETSYPASSFDSAKKLASHMAWPSRPIIDHTKGGRYRPEGPTGTYGARTERA